MHDGLIFPRKQSALYRGYTALVGISTLSSVRTEPIADGQALVDGEYIPRHRAKEFLSFLRRIDRAEQKPRNIHFVLDNYATHNTPEVLAWLEKHPRFNLHFTPTSASWLNLVERFFAEITAKRIRRGS